MIHIAIVEDSLEAREGFRYLLGLDQDIKVLKTYENAEKLLDDTEVLRSTDLVLMDIELPGMDGIRATRIIKQRYPEIRKIGLISTRGTRKARIYADPCEKEGIEIINSVDQESIDQAIYDPDWGIKAVTPVSASARATILDQIEQMQILGVQAVILGCTEIPLAVPETVYHGLPLINPLSILADALITYVNSHNNT